MSDEGGRPGDAGHVLIVDDDRAVLNVVARALRRAGYRVSTFGDPQSFVARPPVDPPCCVILDYQMPGMTGVEVQERLLGMEHPPAIIFMSGAGDVHATVQAMKAGAVDFLAKPFSTRDLLAAVEAGFCKARERLERWNAKREARALLARLTPREREVCLMVAKGLRSKDIAQAIGAAVKTVNIHRSRILAKLGAESAVELSRIVERADGENP